MPEGVHADMRLFSEVKWSEVARKAIIEKLETLKLAEKLAKNSKLSPQDAEQFSKKIKSNATKRFLA